MDIIWRSRPELAMALSVKPSMSGHLRNVQQSRGDGAKPDRVIVGREHGSARHGGRASASRATDNLQNDREDRAKMVRLRNGRTSATAAIIRAKTQQEISASVNWVTRRERCPALSC